MIAEIFLPKRKAVSDTISQTEWASNAANGSNHLKTAGSIHPTTSY